MASPLPQVNAPIGPIGNAVLAYVGSLDLDEHGAALATVALSLAQSLDSGAGMAAAAIAKELRSTLDAMRPAETDDEQDEFLKSLGRPTKVGNSAN